MKKQIGTYVCADCGYSHFVEFDTCPSCESQSVESRIPYRDGDELSADDIERLIAREVGDYEAAS